MLHTYKYHEFSLYKIIILSGTNISLHKTSWLHEPLTFHSSTFNGILKTEIYKTGNVHINTMFRHVHNTAVAVEEQ
jgi:hypothetical protein